jgi:hypothetical protein
MKARVWYSIFQSQLLFEHTEAIPKGLERHYYCSACFKLTTIDSKPQSIIMASPNTTTAAHGREVVPDFAFMLVDRTTLQASTTLTKSRDFFDTNVMTIVHFYDGG